YSLRSLPMRHRCPECGFGFDEFTQVWRPTTLFRFLSLHEKARLLTGLSLGFGALISMMPPLNGLGISIGFQAVGVLVPTAMLYLTFRRRPFFATTPGGVAARLSMRGVETVAWSDIHAIDADAIWSAKRGGERFYVMHHWGRRLDLSGLARHEPIRSQ